jgi:hypothetical protein
MQKSKGARYEFDTFIYYIEKGQNRSLQEFKKQPIMEKINLLEALPQIEKFLQEINT